jgi:FHA domain-containing protein
VLDIIALSYNELPPVVPVRGVIPDEGGTIGRDSENTLVLPDPARLVSRKHGRFVREGDTYAIVNVSDGNSFFVNEKDVAAGAKCPVRDGDLLQIGGYVLRVRLSAGQAGGVTTTATSGTKDVHAPAPVPAPGLPSSVVRRMPSMGDHLAASLPGPFDDLLGAPVAPPKELFRNAKDNLDAVNPVGAHIIPADFDPFGEVPRQRATADLPESFDPNDTALGVVQPRLSPFSVVADDPDIADGRRDSILLPDGVEGVLTMDQQSYDPLALFKDESRSNSLLDALQIGSAEAPPMELAQDFAAAFRAPVGRSLEPSEPDRFSEQAAKQPDAIVTAAHPEPSHDESSAGLAQATAANEPVVTREVGNSVSSGIQDTTAEPLPSLRHVSTNSTGCSDDRAELRRAFETGLQAQLPAQSGEFNADTLRLIGALLRIAIVGTLDLMRARSAVKKEVRVEMTVIEPNDNNPLKLSPDVDIAIQYLFGRKFPGFLGPVDAMTESYSDLTSHQMGMVVGMRSAMEDMIRRFDPAKIEAEAAAKGVLSRISRTRSRSECWDAYCARYQGIADALGNDFQDFYAQAFIRAYEEEIAGCAPVGSPT